MSRAGIVRHVYDRFMKGDARSILATFDERIQFRLAQGHLYQPSGELWRPDKTRSFHQYLDTARLQDVMTPS